MNSFYAMQNPEGTWHIECRCIIYRAMLGKHPDWAKPEGDAKVGYNTKYFLLIEDDLSEADARKKAEAYEKEYAEILSKCENSGNWEMFPFTDNPIIYWK